MFSLPWLPAITLLCSTTTLVHGLKYDASEAEYNLNANTTATNPLDYWIEPRTDHDYHKSPDNWRFPFYTVFMDRFVNGDPTNDNANDTLFETDMMATQIRNGGDLQGLVDSLDYIAGMGIKGIYLAGSPFINQPWGADAYSPLDLTMLDKHFGNVTMWQNTVDEIHDRGMYVILDNTMATLGDLIGFEGYLNTSAPFSVKEHKVEWKTSRQYLDFDFGNTYNESCDYPTFWYETGELVDFNSSDELVGCYNSDFDQYGDIEAFGVYPDWERQLSKFASVQDRLREWYAPVRERLERFSCMTIAALDIDGFRVDKAMQVTVDAQAAFTSSVRDCAIKYNKTNFMVVGEITSGNTLGSIWVGRGRSLDMWVDDVTSAQTLDWNETDSDNFLRDPGNSALDAGAFHYSVYRFLTRFLGLSGNLEAAYDLPTDWVEMWNQMMLSNDFYNANTGEFDPRHLYGVANQDVFRWPGIEQGTRRMMLGYMVTTLLMPGIPLVYYGEEQDLYVVDSTADNYVYGRQAFSPSQAWMRHGCYTLGSTIFVDWPADKAMTGCTDASQALDHRDPSAAIRNTMKYMFSLRDSFPVLEGGWLLAKLSNQTSYTLLSGSTTATEFGIWSVVRAYNTQTQTVSSNSTTPVWLVFHNNNVTTDYTFDCSTEEKAFLSPFDAGKSVRNLMNSSESVYTLEDSSVSNTNWTGTDANMGCFSSITMQPYEFKVFVVSDDYVAPAPMITKFSPGHDFQIDSSVNSTGELEIVLGFSVEMDCTAVSSAIYVESYLDGYGAQNLTSLSSATCGAVNETEVGDFVGYIPTAWTWTATLSGLQDGVHRLTVANASTADGVVTDSIDHFLIRQGLPTNPVVWPQKGNYSSALLTVNDDEIMTVHHRAPGAQKWRYSTNWGSSWSSWNNYTGDTQTVTTLTWSGTSKQAWDGYHLMVQYWSRPLGSSAFIQHGDYGVTHQRHQPHIFMHGDFNDWGFDSGVPNSMALTDNNTWEMHFMYEWPAQVQANIWGMNPDGQSDQTFLYGDIDGDGILDRLAPSSLSTNVFNMTTAPAWPFLSYKIVIDDATWSIKAVPTGSAPLQVWLFWFLAIIPIITAGLAGWVYIRGFYQVKVNKKGFKRKSKLFISLDGLLKPSDADEKRGKHSIALRALSPSSASTSLPVVKSAGERKTVLIATMEYNIDDWNISIKIGGLGVMAKLMSTALEHVNLIWVVPCVGGIEYPMDEPAESMFVEIMGESYEVNVQYHKVKNITYVLLDAPIFRQQTKAEPYIARMDDIESGILYAAWNSCIAEAMRRFPVDIYHINDYHGAIAPLYLLPQVIPVCLSLHNAEFQGLWPMRTPEESKEVCEVFNLPNEVVKKYVQYGSVFNLLHAGASYLRYHQRGFGAVGVSKKYGDRSLARYPIFWSLKNIGQLPNPDPSDTAAWEPEKDATSSSKDGIEIDEAFEASRADLRVKAQEWAGLEVDPTAELFVFVGRWSLQKGVDLIADIFPSILEKYPKTQLICVGPVIDLYGKFAALKLAKLMEKYPRRVFSKPEFTQLPPYIFSGAEFALIPSRDEPFGLVAVEFGRKGALGVGARVGGLGQMPGWWYTVESMTPAHLLDQFRHSLKEALESKKQVRALMRAWSAKQRFPVKQWVHQIDNLYDESIRISHKEATKKKNLFVSRSMLSLNTYANDSGTGPDTPGTSRPSTPGFKVEISSPTMVSSSLMHHSSPSPDLQATSPNGLPSPFPWSSLEPGSHASVASFDSFAMRAQQDGHTSMRPGSVAPDFTDPMTGLPLPKPSFYQQGNRGSQLSLSDVVGERHDMKLQKVDLSFTDANGEFFAEYQEMLDGITAKNSHTDLCIEEFLKKSEKEWFKRYRNAKLGIDSRDASRTRSPMGRRPESRDGKHRNSSIVSRGRPRHRSITPHSINTYMSTEADSPRELDVDDEFLLGSGYKAPTGLRKFLSIRIGDWPIYAFLMALGQILSVNSYQITLLTGEASQTTNKLYIIGSVYLVTSIMWWLMVRNFKSLYSIALPWAFFGLAFACMGITGFISDSTTQETVELIATVLYAAGASSGGVMFALNFGDEGGSPTKSWVLRAISVAGISQVYTLMLWYWGSLVALSEATITGTIGNSDVPLGLVVCVPLAVVFWVIGVVLFLGLPDYYRQSPESIPGLYISLLHRKLVPWFFVAIIIQNYWLSAPYGRNWEFLFDSQYLPAWAAAVLALGFFVGLWSIVLYVFSLFSDEHTWLLPIFAIGLGAPRWAQMLWGCSGIGWYVPWVGSGLASAILSRCLWLWLGLLDAIQGVGLGMMLLATLTRQHVLAVLIGTQAVGAAVTMLARATSPNRLDANTTFPDFSQGALPGAAQKWFWICLAFQLVIPFGYFKFFRKEQVAKP
ncbi:family 5 glycosyltransferase [Cryphonectria parasitica EP155]|uniref:alpha-1,3-glucan synthase n=1 Tax=Cryphonectria parasitica (strain ATCC 38755 / EP155) TaxID=660469 RepID=A0A9P4XVG3_CRYP1|nr:family 5 glycosyltransferase [Cryphonectria parasitica EP155]KAF3761562.1 family 5 glycosyltransferase [Cryphonectria parasitica EP155]